MAHQPDTDNVQGLMQIAALDTKRAVVVSVLWVVAVGLSFWLVPSDAAVGGLRHVIMVLVMCVPVAMLALAVVMAHQLRVLQTETAYLRKTLAAVQSAAVPPRPVADAAKPRAAPEPLPSGFATRRDAPRPLNPRPPILPGMDQPALALGAGGDDDAPPLDRADLVRALNFPDDQHDEAGFAALRRALRDRGARHLVQASQDVLTLLSQDGIYMDDLRPDPASADMWRRFAKGERGRSMDGLGAVRDPSVITTVTTRMREDAIFRDCVHHFMRRFDQILVTFEQDATDTDLLTLAETRTARAFMLVGRASRTFD